MKTITKSLLKEYAEKVKQSPVFGRIQEVRGKLDETFGHLTLDELDHVYTSAKEPSKEFISVTTLVHKYIQEQDWEMIAERYAVKNKMEKKVVQENWDWTKYKACVLGTKTHLLGETICLALLGYMDGKSEEEVDEICFKNMGSQYSKMNGELSFIPITTNEEKVITFWLDVMTAESVSYIPVAAEQIIDHPSGFAGTIDLLMWFAPLNKMVVMDYKTNSKLEDSYARKENRRLLMPFTDLIDEALSHYTLQLAFYTRALVDAKVIDINDVLDYQLIHVNGSEKRDEPQPRYDLVRVNSGMYVHRVVE